MLVDRKLKSVLDCQYHRGVLVFRCRYKWLSSITCMAVGGKISVDVLCFSTVPSFSFCPRLSFLTGTVGISISHFHPQLRREMSTLSSKVWFQSVDFRNPGVLTMGHGRPKSCCQYFLSFSFFFFFFVFTGVNDFPLLVVEKGKGGNSTPIPSLTVPQYCTEMSLDIWDATVEN